MIAAASNSKTNAKHQAERLQAHADFLTERQRQSGIRVRICSTGCYSLYDAAGHFIGRTAPVAAGLDIDIAPARLKTAAARMAYSEELANACRLVDLDVEASGAVSASTIERIRGLLGAIGAA